MVANHLLIYDHVVHALNISKHRISLSILLKIEFLYLSYLSTLFPCCFKQFRRSNMNFEDLFIRTPFRFNPIKSRCVFFVKWSNFYLNTKSFIVIIIIMDLYFIRNRKNQGRFSDVHLIPRQRFGFTGDLASSLTS